MVNTVESALVQRNRNQWRPRIPTMVAWLVRITAVFTVIDLVQPVARYHARTRMGEAAVEGAVVAVAVIAAGVMLVLAHGLQRRQRRAWFFALVAVGIAIVTHVRLWHSGLPSPALVINGAVAVLLWWSRWEFTAISWRQGRWVAVRVLLTMVTVSVVAGLAITARTAPASSWTDRLAEVLYGLVGFTPELAFRRPELSLMTEIALNALGAATILLTVLAFLAPVQKSANLTAEADRLLRELLRRHGDADSLGYFALRSDKCVIFSPSGKAAVAYRVEGSVTLAAGDPIGDPEAWPHAIASWLGEAAAYAWTPGVIGASEAGALAYQRAGFDALELGDEAIVDLATFNLQGRAMRVVRQAANRVERAGYTVRIDRQSMLDADELAVLDAAVHDWRGTPSERGFSMALGRLGDVRDADLLVVRSWDVHGELAAVITMVPWGSAGYSLDLMRRRPNTDNGVIESMIVQVARQATELGITRLSLNFAVFRAVFERGARVGAGPALRFWHRLLLIASQWWQIESLYRANAKYQPQWVPRFICFRRAVELPRVGIAALEAEAFVRWPRLRSLVQR